MSEGLAATRADQTPASSASPTKLRRIWLVADDYGISPGVNAAIRDLLARGRLNATSVMVVPPSFSPSAAKALVDVRASNPNIAVGLHLTLTAPFTPLSRHFAPLRGDKFLPLAAMMARAFAMRLDARKLRTEIEAQLAAFSSAFGRAPDFVDGHQHIHLLPRVRTEVIAAVKSMAPQAWLRQCSGLGSPWRHVADPKTLLISLLSQGLVRDAAAGGIATNPAFAGVYRFSAGADIARLFPRFLDGLPGGSVVMCHPGQVDPELQRLDSLTTLREREYAFFRSDAFPRVMAAHGFTLV
jgi:predicted glycoside hydrolase/deacetylase ChbG (UPF0249 family)